MLPVNICDPPQIQGKQPVDIPPEYDVCGGVIPQMDICAEKIFTEMGNYIKEYRMVWVLGTEQNPRQAIEFYPRWMIYFRSGSVRGTPGGTLATLDGMTGYYRSLGIPVVYYLDDFLWEENNMAPLKLAMNCDGAIVAADVLKEYLIEKGYPKPIYMLKTHMDIPVFDMLPHIPIEKDNNFNIFYTSEGRIGVQMLHRIVEYMDQHAERYRKARIFILSNEVAQVRSVLNKYRNVRKEYSERVPLNSYYQIANQMHLILAPGEPGDLDYWIPNSFQSQWLAAKSCVKYTLAGAATIPCIASSHLREYVSAIQHEKTGFIANDLDEWMKYIDICMNEPIVHQMVGEAARMDIEERFHIYQRTEEFANLIRSWK